MPGNTWSAWASASAGWVVVTASTLIPARWPASTPAGASSTTTHCPGGTPSAAAARRYGSGSGLPCSTSSPVTRTSGAGNPTVASRCAASSRPPDVTTAHGPRRATAAHSSAPGIRVRSSSASSNPVIRRTCSADPRCGANFCTISAARRPWIIASTSSMSRPCSAAHRGQARSTTRAESTSTPSRSNRTAVRVAGEEAGTVTAATLTWTPMVTGRSPPYWIPPRDLDVEAILLGGDIHYRPDGLGEMLREIRATQHDATWLIVIPGNGEYAHQELGESRRQYREAVESVPGAVFLDDQAVVVTIGSTLVSSNPRAGDGPQSINP